MAQIELTQDKVALVDDSDFEHLNQFKWYAARNHYGGFIAQRRCDCWVGKQSHMIRMHRQITSCPQRLQTDHRNHNTLDNHRSNLRICTNAQNAMNKNGYKNHTSIFKGVSWYKATKQWQAQIKFNQKNIYLGYFNLEIDAAKAYNQKAKELFGEFALLNKVA